MRIGEKLFWNLYARCYDTIARLRPYQELQEAVLRSAGLNGEEHVLDAGCGSGNFLSLFIRRGNRRLVTGVDLSSSMLALAKKKCGDSTVEWRQLDLNGPLPYPDQTFGCIVSTHVLYALKTPQQALAEFCRVLRPGGTLVLVTPKHKFNMFAILWEHLKMLRHWSQWVEALGLFLPLSAVILFNMVILRNARKRIYHFYSREELHGILSSLGLKLNDIASTYAGQSWFTVAEKPVCHEKLKPRQELVASLPAPQHV